MKYLFIQVIINLRENGAKMHISGLQRGFNLLGKEIITFKKKKKIKYAC